QYASAISDFLHGFNECRGIIASRFFRGPKQFGWPRFRILPLSEERRLELVRKATLTPIIENDLLGHLDSAPQDIRAMASNPMFLSLLCAHMKAGSQFPENAHTILESYINSRFIRDEKRIYKHFKLTPAEVRTTAEVVSFCMAADEH